MVRYRPHSAQGGGQQWYTLLYLQRARQIGTSRLWLWSGRLTRPSNPIQTKPSPPQHAPPSHQVREKRGLEANDPLGDLESAACGGAAGLASVLVTHPIDTVKVGQGSNTGPPSPRPPPRDPPRHSRPTSHTTSHTTSHHLTTYLTPSHYIPPPSPIRTTAESDAVAHGFSVPGLVYGLCGRRVAYGRREGVLSRRWCAYVPSASRERPSVCTV